jgi:hypothetical protein
MVSIYHSNGSQTLLLIGSSKLPSPCYQCKDEDKLGRISKLKYRLSKGVERETLFLWTVEFYSVEAWKRRTTDASAKNPIPNKTSATDSSTFGDCASPDNWTLPILITARAGRAKIAEITATNEAT